MKGQFADYSEKAYLEAVQEMRSKLRKKLKPDRYEHSLSVSFTAVCLAMRHGADLRQAEIAGLVHDCAKQFSNEELLERCAKHHVEISEEMRKAPQVIHAEYGAFFARKSYGIEDPEILSAIRYHTLGRAELSLLEAIIFTADYIEARRSKAERLPLIRYLAFSDLDRCIYEIMHDTIRYLEKSGSYVCGDCLSAYQYYQKRQEESK